MIFQILLDDPRKKKLFDLARPRLYAFTSYICTDIFLHDSKFDLFGANCDTRITLKFLLLKIVYRILL